MQSSPEIIVKNNFEDYQMVESGLEPIFSFQGFESKCRDGFPEIVYYVSSSNSAVVTPEEFSNGVE